MQGSDCLRLAPIVLGFYIVASTGCGPRAERPAATAPAAEAVSLASLHVGPPLTEDECQDFAQRLTDAVHSDEDPGLDELIDWDALFARATAGLEAPRRFRERFIDGAREAMHGPGGFSAQLAQAVSAGGSYRFLRVRNGDGQPRALFRLLLPGSGGVNYHELPLARRGEGRVMAVDIHIYLTGELMSDTMRRAFVPIAADASAGLIERLAGREQDLVKHFSTVERMMTEVRAGRHQAGLAAYRQLPESLQREKTFLILRMQAAQALNEQEYAAAIADLERFHPDDPCIDILSIDGHLLKKQYALALRSIGRLDKAIGGDPYLDVLKSNVSFEQGDLPAAREAAERAVAGEPTLPDAHWALVTVLLKQQDFGAALDAMTRLEEEFQADFSRIETEPLYEPLVRSPEYAVWRDARKKK
jgi:tetratricopeptide (TPR) repeat protein